MFDNVFCSKSLDHVFRSFNIRTAVQRVINRAFFQRTFFTRTFFQGTLLCTIACSALAGPDYNSIAFHPVPLSEEPAANLSELARQDEKHTDNPLLPGADDYLQTSAEQYRAAIQALELSEGPYALAVAQQSEALGDLLARSGDFQGAVEAYSRTLHVHRINDGLYSPGQESILRKIIQAELADNNVENAHAMHESLLYLQKRLHSKGDSGYIAAILEWADWHVDRLLLEDGSLGIRNDQGFSALNMYLITAQDNYINAIEMIRSSEAVAPAQQQRLVHAEKKLAAINYIANSKTVMATALSPQFDAHANADIHDNDPFATKNNRENNARMAFFFNGSNALKRAIAYSLESPAPDYLSIAEQMMALGDWYLLFDRRTAALSVYEDAYEVLDAVQASEDEMRRIMTPGMPVTAPDAPGTAQTSYHGYIDVKFQVSKFGIATSPEVIATSGQDVSPVTRALIRKIRSEKFRPAFIDGTATNSENFKLRYYYSYN